MYLALVLASLVTLSEGWQYAVTAPQETPPHDATWSDDFAVKRGFDVWTRNRLPRELPPDAHIVFRAWVSDFALYVDDERFYEFHDPAARGRLRMHAVPLPANAAGAQVYVRVIDPRGVPLVGRPTIAAQAEVARAEQQLLLDPIRADAADIIIGAFLLVLGLTSVAAAQLLRRGTTHALFWFGLLALLYGARLLADSYLLIVLGGHVRGAQSTTAFITYVIPIAGWTLAQRLLGRGWRNTLQWQVYVFGVFAPIGIISDLITRNPGSLEVVNNVLVIAGAVNVLVNLFLGPKQRSVEVKAILAGSTIFVLFALNNNLAALGLLPWNEAPEAPGFVAFVAALGFAATRMFVRTERERVALQGELATAREIQRSILPTSMPSVGDLRFEAHFDPASSVAGDLYDFLIIDDARVGVLVADVSGHGVPAALVAAMMKIAVSSQSRHAHEPGTLLREVNRTLRGQVRRAFVTATYLYVDTTRSVVEVANAGHPPPLLRRAGEVRELGPRGVLLGRFDAQYETETIALQRGDRLLVYTDGVIEARNARGEEFGETRLQEMLRNGASADVIAAAVRRWRDEKNEADDVTLLIIDLPE